MTFAYHPSKLEAELVPHTSSRIGAQLKDPLLLSLDCVEADSSVRNINYRIVDCQVFVISIS